MIVILGTGIVFVGWVFVPWFLLLSLVLKEAGCLSLLVFCIFWNPSEVGSNRCDGN